jgi:DNA-binding protein HU-beta
MPKKNARLQLATELNKHLGKTLTLREAEHLTGQFVDALVSVLIEHGELRLNEYGKLKVVERAARDGRNPQTGAAISIPARKTVQYKPSPKLLKALASR